MIPPLIAGIIQLAPAIAGFLGKGEKETQIIADLAAKVTGHNEEANILTSLKDHPEHMIDLQRMLLEHKTEQERIHADDKANARARDQEFIRSGTRNIRADFLVAVSVVVVLTILAVVILVTDLNEYAKGALTTILGVFLNQLTNVFSFEFGTTRKGEEDTSRIVKDYINAP